MPPIKQAKAITKTLENIGNNTIQPMGKVMLESGYKKSVAKNPKILTESKNWKEAMASIDYGKHLRQLDALADTKINQDKDNVLRSKDMLFKLADKYPKGESKIVGIFNRIEQVQE